MIAVDTNLLVHAHRKEAELHIEATACIKSLAEDLSPWCVCFHNFVEFYGIVSHPKIWDIPSTPDQVGDQISAWRESPSIRIVTEYPADIDRLLALAIKAKIKGPMIHDARIASCCLANGIRELWTIDRDFSRFPELKVRNPLL